MTASRGDLSPEYRADFTTALQTPETTSLHWASWFGHSAVVRELLEHGADVAAEDAVGPEFCACRWASC